MVFVFVNIHIHTHIVCLNHFWWLFFTWHNSIFMDNTNYNSSELNIKSRKIAKKFFCFVFTTFFSVKWWLLERNKRKKNTMMMMMNIRKNIFSVSVLFFIYLFILEFHQCCCNLVESIKNTNKHTHICIENLQIHHYSSHTHTHTNTKEK